MKLSFIIPIYNGAEFLERCIVSLCSQNLKEDEYEMICIDDCSSDDSIDILAKLRLQYQNLRVIKNKVNLKTGTTCNIGLDNARGKYIWIIGQDDYIKSNSARMLIDKMDSESLDTLAFNYKRINSKEDELHSAVVFKNSDVKSGVEYLNNYFDESFDSYLLGYEWRAIYRKKYLENQSIRFVDGVIYEDTTFLFKALYFSERVASIEDYIYYYRVNDSSITDVNKKYRSDLIFEFAFVTGYEVWSLSENKRLYGFYSQILRKRAIWYYRSFGYKILSAPFEEVKLFYLLLQQQSDIVQERISHLSFIYKALGDPHFGMFICILLRPLYLLKNRILPKREQKYCY